MQSRAEALQNVESTIHELSNIFTQLATMVSQQGEIAIRSIFNCFHVMLVGLSGCSRWHYLNFFHLPAWSNPRVVITAILKIEGPTSPEGPRLYQ